MREKPNPYEMPSTPSPLTGGPDEDQSGGYYDYDEGPQRNGLAVVGFVFSLLGPLALIGVIISAIALRRRPRGFAVAGVIVGLVMLVLSALCIGAVGWSVSLSLQIQPKQEEIIGDYLAIQTAVETYKTNNAGALPPDLASLGLGTGVTTSPFGDTYHYETSGTNWTIGFEGEDGVRDTQDDTRLEGGRRPIEEDIFGWQDLTQALLRGVPQP